MKRLLLALFPLCANASPFAEVSLSVRQQQQAAPPTFVYDRQRDCWQYTLYGTYDMSSTHNPYGNVKVGWQ